MPTRRELLQAGLSLTGVLTEPRWVDAFVLPHMSRRLADEIRADNRLVRADSMARQLLASGLKAGTSYPEVWIRDTNTFLEMALRVAQGPALREALLRFLDLQGESGDIVDGYAPVESAGEPAYRTSPRLPGLTAHKNTVESDQESSLVSAVRKYVEATGDRALLDEQVRGVTVRMRLGQALEYLWTERFDAAHGLIWSGTTVDWGDVQPETMPGTHLNAQSHHALGIYTNAMAAIAARDYLLLVGRSALWEKRHALLLHAMRRHLWEDARAKPVPHMYLDGSPFPADVDEGAMYFFGGTAAAIEAGLLDRAEVVRVLAWMRAKVRAAGASSIGLTVYPPYRAGIFKDPILTQPYTYQNGGDWCWFGGRMVQQLMRFGLVEEAYRELIPMLDRVLAAGAFYEWWTPDNQPRGSAGFKGGAGVLGKAIEMLQAAAG